MSENEKDGKKDKLDESSKTGGIADGGRNRMHANGMREQKCAGIVDER